jgi:thiol-disulfide isomerase/thioredoxin
MVSATTMNKIVLAAIFVVGVALVYWWSRMTPAIRGDGGSEGFTDGSMKFVMYGVEWCPHCVKAKPEFAALGATKTIGGKTVECIVVDPEKEPEKVKGKVEGYPTFHLYDAQGTLVKEYGGPRTTAGFEKFLQETVRA